MLMWLVGDVWQRGWQPSELARHGRRTDAPVGRIITALIDADNRRRDPATVHPRWIDQIDAVRVRTVPEHGWLVDLLDDEEVDGIARVLLIASTLLLLAHLDTLPTILPPPGSDSATWNHRDDTGAADDPVLAKVRALLAQAESTTFEAEAETFTAKAQELMARHAIDAALLWSRSASTDEPVTVRLAIDDPYADQKAYLLHVVAKHSRCRAVRHERYGLQSVVGFASDVAATEMLFTSLLVQSQTAMMAEASNAPPGSRTRGRSFRSSFLYAYACRIDKRLAEITESVEASVEASMSESTAEHGSRSSLLPVLAARADRIDEAIAETFGELRSSPVRCAGDRLGWARGALAADRAQLNSDLPTGAPGRARALAP